MKRIILLVLIFLSCAISASADHLISSEKALKKVYRTATEFKEKYIDFTSEQVNEIEKRSDILFSSGHSSRIVMYEAYENGMIIGYAYEDTVLGKWGPIHYLVGLDLQGTVLETVILDYDEIRGKPVAKKRFLKQYKGKNMDDPVKLRRDIDGVSGATISSRSLTDGVRKILFIHATIH